MPALLISSRSIVRRSNTAKGHPSDLCLKGVRFVWSQFWSSPLIWCIQIFAETRRISDC